MNHDIPKLTAQVKAENKVRQLVNKVAPTLAERFQPLVGKQILKVDGSVMKKYIDTLSIGHDTYRLNSDYSLGYEFKTCEQITGSSGCLYEKYTLYVGNTKQGVLTDIDSILKFTPLRADFTVDEIIAKREEYARLKNLADSAKSALYPFGEY